MQNLVRLLQFRLVINGLCGVCAMGIDPLLLQIVAIASAALDEYKVDAKKMVVNLVDMERAFIPPQHFIRLVQRRCSPTYLTSTMEMSDSYLVGTLFDVRFFFAPLLKERFTNRMDRLRREDDGKGRQVKKAQDAEQSLLSKVSLSFQNIKWMKFFGPLYFMSLLGEMNLS